MLDKNLENKYITHTYLHWKIFLTENADNYSNKILLKPDKKDNFLKGRKNKDLGPPAHPFLSMQFLNDPLLRQRLRFPVMADGH